MDYPVDLHVSIRIFPRLSATTSKIVSFSHSLLSLGMLAICVKNRVHLNGITIDHKNRTIERFEPYGDKTSKNSVLRNKLIDSQLERIVSKFYSPQGCNLSFTCNRFFPPGHLGPQSRDPPKTGYCGAWSILYLENAISNNIENIDKLDFEFIKKYSEQLYSMYPRHPKVDTVGRPIVGYLKLKYKKFKTRANCIQK